jgi:hypothetical protein
MTQRALWQTLADWFDAVLPVGEATSILRVTSLQVDAPLEVVLWPRAGEWELLADVARWRRPSGFDRPPGRFKIVWDIKPSKPDDKT